MRALVRQVASSFVQAIRSDASQPLLLDAAQQQHGAYVALLQQLLGAANVTALPADEAHPDCCFIEDTAVVVGRTAVVAAIGAGPRRGEEAPVAAALAAAGRQLVRLTPPATLDGGDVLQLPGSGPPALLVGLSARTNAAGVAQLAAALPGARVVGVPLPRGLLHLKSAMTAVDESTLLLADDECGQALRRGLEAQHPELLGPAGRLRHVLMVPRPVAANVLLVQRAGRGGDAAPAVVAQGGCAASEALLRQACSARGLELHLLPAMSEFSKADGALTCLSILLPDDVAASA